MEMINVAIYMSVTMMVRGDKYRRVLWLAKEEHTCDDRGMWYKHDR